MGGDVDGISDGLGRWPVGARIAERFQTSHFDAQILAAAKRMRCATVYSEDLNHDQDYGGVRVVNPFLPVP